MTFVTPAFLHPESSDSPGVRRYSSDLVRALARKGIRLRVVTFSEEGNSASPPADVEVVRLRSGRNLSGRTGNIAQARVLSFAKRFAHASSLIRETDIVHADIPLLAIDSIRPWCPVVAMSHHVERIRGPGDLASVPFGNAYGAYTYRRADAVVTPSESTASRLMQRFKVSLRKIHVIHHGIDSSKFFPERPPGGNPPVPGVRTILFVGPMYRRKNVLLLLAAFGQLIRAHPDTRLVLVGSGPLDRQIDRTIRKQSLEGKVIRLAHVDDARLRQLYSSADLYVSPSADEGFGLSVVEAMACRTPVVVMDTPISREIVGDAGALVTNATREAWSGVIGSVLEDKRKAEAFAERGYRRVKERYSWDAAAERYFELFRELVEGYVPNNRPI